MKKQLKSDSSVASRDFILDFLQTDVVCVDRDMSLIEVAVIMHEQQVGDVVVTKLINNKLKPIGMITDRDLVMGVLAQHRTADFMRAGDLMTQPICVANDTDGIYDMISVMKREEVGRLPIVDDEGGLVGIITAKKILQLLAQEFTDLVSITKSRQIKKGMVEH